MREGPLRAPSSPPEIPIPTNRMPLVSNSSPLLIVLGYHSLPPSTMISPASIYLLMALIVRSTGFPACTNNTTLRGRFSFLMKSSGPLEPTMGSPPSPLARFTVSATLIGDLFPTQTVNPCDAIFRAKFCPMTASPYRPTSATPSEPPVKDTVFSTPAPASPPVLALMSPMSLWASVHLQ